MLPAGAGLTFRIFDSSGKDLLYTDSLKPGVYQPCREDSLRTNFKSYRIPGSSDSGTVMAFSNLNTPAPGSSGECFRLFVNWPGDQDTIDWHYRVDLEGNCKFQIIDYISYNGIQAIKKTDYAQEYYALTKLH